MAGKACLWYWEETDEAVGALTVRWWSLSETGEPRMCKMAKFTN